MRIQIPQTIPKLSSQAFTLLEVLLSLSLLMALMLIIGTAIDTHLNNQTQSRLQVEESQLARSILNRIAADIRAAVLDSETKENSKASNSATAIGESETSGETTTDTANAETSENTDDTEYADDFENNIIGTKKGIYGGLDWLQIDTMRATPGERFNYQADSYNYSNYDEIERMPELDQLDCGHKTVLYYLGYDTATADADEEYQKQQLGSSVAPNPDGQTWMDSPIRYGLYYREMNRLMTQYAVEQGLDSASNMSERDEHLAPEVDNIEFLYYINDDPKHAIEEGEWLEEWDMDAEDGILPLAIQITLSIRRKSYKPTMMQSLLSADNEQERIIKYSLIVPLSFEMIDFSEVVAEETTETSSESTQ
ncbi:MAG: hypothetical protein LBJ67_03360 [Planctomycetaceae bacterium]|jgi:type II secretory pathway pseudopilin PulG|nr:hypothetical protein [Planctomycetaceae bacterium]